MANKDEQLRESLERSDAIQPVYRSNYEDIKEYYKEHYKETGAKSWIGAYAHSVTGKSSGPEYRAARRSIERYETGQQKTSQYTSGTKVVQVGQALPPETYRLKGNSLTLTINAKQHDTRGGVMTELDRKINVTFRGNNAVLFAANPTWADVWDTYGIDYDIAEDGEYEIVAYNVSAS